MQKNSMLKFLKKRRTGFTLVELLMVIVILALLIALLLPAITGAVRNAREAGSVAEMNAISQALSDFKSQFNEYPPSRIVVAEDGNYSAANLGTYAYLGPRTVAALRKYWPRMSISTSGAPGSIPGPGYYDFNGNGVNDHATPYVLNGPQCLVFFLGGIPQPTASGGTTGFAVTGFAKNPSNPMQTSASTTNRIPPLYEFNNSRLIADPNHINGVPGYIDSLGSFDNPLSPPFYAYFSAYSGVGYDPGDYDVAELDSNGSTAMLGAFQTNNSANANYMTGTNFISSAPPNPYLNDVPVPTLSTGHVDTTGTGIAARARAYQNPNSFQIISPGYDRLYGIGGQYLATVIGADRLPFVQGAANANTFQTALANSDVTSASLSADARVREKDNLTSFAPGRLD